MSFDIFASGSGHYHFAREKLVEGADFELARVVGKLQFMEVSPKGVLNGVVDMYGPEANITDAATAVAQLTFLQMLHEAVDSLAMNAGTAGSSISVSATNTHSLWPDTVRFVKYAFCPGDFPGLEFFKTIAQTLHDTDMDNWGVLRALAIVIDDYSDTISRRKNPVNPMLFIQLTK